MFGEVFAGAFGGVAEALGGGPGWCGVGAGGVLVVEGAQGGLGVVVGELVVAGGVDGDVVAFGCGG